MPLTVEIWSDVVCPWCYIGKRRFEKALEAFAHAGEVTVMWRSFELDPEAPEIAEGAYPERLAAKYGMTVERATQLGAEMTQRAASEGLEFHLDRSRSGNTFDAHRLIHLAATYGHQAAAEERLMRAYFTEGEPISDRETLIRLVSELGVDAEEARAALELERFSEDVREDELLVAAAQDAGHQHDDDPGAQRDHGGEPGVVDVRGREGQFDTSLMGAYPVQPCWFPEIEDATGGGVLSNGLPGQRLTTVVLEDEPTLVEKTPRTQVWAMVAFTDVSLRLRISPG